MVVDGTDGEVIIDPPLAIRKEFEEKKERYDDYRLELRKTAALTSSTLDGTKFTPLANIELPEEVKSALSLGAEGIGLFRSEFIYFQKTSLPSVEDHFLAYNKIAKEADPAPVYIRTVDIGGEKNLPQLNIEKEPNPALGLRAIRFSLREGQLFKTQLRAILRASVHGKVRLMFPMISGMAELRTCKRILREVQEGLTQEGVAFDRELEVGIMVETPSAVLLADFLADEVDFFSIGTNDLIQYCLAVDRGNEHVAYLYDPLHPAILRAIKAVCQAANDKNVDVCLCGEMAAEPIYALVLLGLGLHELSMNPASIPRVKRVIRQVSRSDGEKLVEKLLTLKTVKEVSNCLDQEMRRRLPEVFDHALI